MQCVSLNSYVRVILFWSGAIETVNNLSPSLVVVLYRNKLKISNMV